MIEVYSRNNLDVNAYNKCLANSINARIYANSWYLDAVADNWEVLVLNNYEAVMPLPWNEKLFIKYIYPPVWTQQLGVFSNKKLSTETIELFLKSIPKKFKKITIQLNSWNYIKNVHLQIKNNYILPLDKSYDEIIKGYNKNRKRDLQKAHQEEFKIVENTTEEGFLAFYLKNANKFQTNKLQISKLKCLLNAKKGQLISVQQNDKIEASLYYFIDEKRLTYLLPVATKQAKRRGFSTLLIDYLMKKHANSNLIFDFEGSMSYGTAKFYSSFGSTKELYFLYTKTRF